PTARCIARQPAPRSQRRSERSVVASCVSFGGTRWGLVAVGDAVRQRVDGLLVLVAEIVADPERLRIGEQVRGLLVGRIPLEELLEVVDGLPRLAHLELLDAEVEEHPLD